MKIRLVGFFTFCWRKGFPTLLLAVTRMTSLSDISRVQRGAIVASRKRASFDYGPPASPHIW